MKTTLPEPEIITRKGKPVSVILPIADYQELVERVEDVQDVAWLKQARRKPQKYSVGRLSSGEMVSVEDFIQERNEMSRRDK